MFSDDDQLHHDINVLNQRQPMTPGAFNQDEPTEVDGPDPLALWLCAFALIMLLVVCRVIPWYWSVIYQVATLAWVYWSRR